MSAPPPPSFSSYNHPIGELIRGTNKAPIGVLAQNGPNKAPIGVLWHWREVLARLTSEILMGESLRGDAVISPRGECKLLLIDPVVDSDRVLEFSLLVGVD